MSKKKYLWAAGVLGLLLICLWAAANGKGLEEMPLLLGLQTRWEMHKAGQLLHDEARTADEKESCLIEAGFSVLDSDPVYPEFLANGEALAAFWEKAALGLDAEASLYRVTEEGALRQLLFFQRNGEAWLYTADGIWSESGLTLENTQLLPIYDMELADWGIFYYRCYPAGDPHYIDYNQIRLAPVDREGYDLLRTYVLPVGYQMANLFLVDWCEGDWGDLAVPDLLEFLYGKYSGRNLHWEQYPGSTSCIYIPAQLFEETLRPYFAMDLETFRGLCNYEAETDSYPWRPIHGDMLTTLAYPMCEPELAACRENGDGTLTLKVRVQSPECKTDCLFAHEVTVRPLEEGFQYVSNRVTSIGEQGLPYAGARFELE